MFSSSNCIIPKCILARLLPFYLARVQNSEIVYTLCWGFNKQTYFIPSWSGALHATATGGLSAKWAKTNTEAKIWMNKLYFGKLTQALEWTICGPGWGCLGHSHCPAIHEGPLQISPENFHIWGYMHIICILADLIRAAPKMLVSPDTSLCTRGSRMRGAREKPTSRQTSNARLLPSIQVEGCARSSRMS